MNKMFDENDIAKWKKTFETNKSKEELEFRLKEVRRMLVDMSEAMTKLMSEEEHISIQLKLMIVLKNKEAGNGIS